jgi:polyphosphate kinase
MSRNLVRRIELFTGIDDETAAQKAYDILKLQCSDNVLAYELQSDGNYLKVTNDKTTIIDSQRLMESHANKIHKDLKKREPNAMQQLGSRLLKES